MVRKLAQRLVAFDLLEPASVLLQYQVDNRIRGVGKPPSPSTSRRSICGTSGPTRRSPRSTRRASRNCRRSSRSNAACSKPPLIATLDAIDHVIELVEPLEGVEAKSLLADAYWRDRKWPEASKALMSHAAARRARRRRRMATPSSRRHRRAHGEGRRHDRPAARL
jgi:hypothetical protein